jgi:NAD(P)-dependent dehydrogenase (short-subunit alcohol dehydrogenase family)
MNFDPLNNLNGQTAVITGVCGGIGYATAARLAARGARIIGLVRRDLESAQAKLNQLPNPELKHTALLADITNGDQLTNAANLIDRCDILVNSAGSTVFIPHHQIELLDDKLFDDMMINNLRSVFATIRTFVPLLKQSDNAIIINIGSASAVRGGGSNLAYAAAKAGVDSLTRNLAKSLAPIRVLSVSPGSLDTDFVKNRPDNLLENTTKRSILQRGATVDEVAIAVETYATVLRFNTGIVIPVDGGII